MDETTNAAPLDELRLRYARLLMHIGHGPIDAEFLSNVPESAQESLVSIGRTLERYASERRECAACGAPLYMVRHYKTEKLSPFTAAGLNHFADCPQAERFRGRK